MQLAIHSLESDTGEDRCHKQGRLPVKTEIDRIIILYRRLIETAIENFNEIDLLILNAGVNAHFVFEDLKDIDVFHRVMNVNFFGYLYTTK